MTSHLSTLGAFPAALTIVYLTVCMSSWAQEAWIHCQIRQVDLRSHGKLCTTTDMAIVHKSAGQVSQSCHNTETLFLRQIGKTACFPREIISTPLYNSLNLPLAPSLYSYSNIPLLLSFLTPSSPLLLAKKIIVPLHRRVHLLRSD